MSIKLSRTLQDKLSASGIAQAVREYEHRFRAHNPSALENEANSNKHITELYYDLVTDFYEYGRGKSFHFAPRIPGESFKESLARHERFLAD